MAAQTPQDDIAAGQAALKIADWSAARSYFEKAVRQTDMPEAHDGLGITLWWLNEISLAHHHRTIAYNGFKQRGAFGRAALIACWLAREQVFLNANALAMQGWFARAEHLLNQLEPNIEHAWFQILRASMLENPHALQQIALQTIESAHHFNNSNLEAFALAFAGQATVTQGHIPEGMAQLDEAMTMATGGEVTDFTIISEIFCVMLSACETVGDLVRCEHWCRMAAAFAEQHQCPFLSAYCRTTYGSLMTALGRWQEAETSLMEAIRAFEVGHRGLRVHAVIRLADLRVHQGKIEEAEVMLAGLEDQGSALVPLARLSLAKGETNLARALLEQGLQNPYTLNQIPALLLLVDVLLTINDGESAHRIVDELTVLAEQTRSELLIAQIELAKGCVNLYVGDTAHAKTNFSAALRYLQTYEQSLIAGQVRLKMAQTLQASDPYGAITWAKAALATFERIGADRDSNEAMNLLRQLGAASTSTPRLRKPITHRESEIISLIALGLTNREIAERLVISPKTVEHHVSQILDKLNLRSRTEAAAFAVSGKLTEIKK